MSDPIQLSDLAEHHGITTAAAREILIEAGCEVLPDDEGDEFVLQDAARAALFAAGKYPLIVGCDPAAPPPVFSPSLEAFDDE